MPEAPASVTVLSSVYIQCKGISSLWDPCPLSSHDYRICSLNTLHWSRPCCRLLRQWLPPLPHQWSWQDLSLFLFSLFFFLLQPFLFPPALPLISVKGHCPSVPLFYGGQRVFRLHQLPSNPTIYPSLELFHQQPSLISAPSGCPLKFLHKLFHHFPSLLQLFQFRCLHQFFLSSTKFLLQTRQKFFY